MNNFKLSIAGLLLAGGMYATGHVLKTTADSVKDVSEPVSKPGKGCVFRTIFENEGDSTMYFATPGHVKKSLGRALTWMVNAQHSSGGWGAGSHSRQGVMDPHAVSADPATTAMVCMALVRNGSTLTSGEYSSQLKRGLEYLLKAVETSDKNSLNITTETNTQIQSKLGQNIDVVMTTQFLTNMLDYVDHDIRLKKRIQKNLDECVAKVQRGQNQNGSFAGAGWAGVLQSSFATTALESAEGKGAKVDKDVLNRSREYQKSNYDEKTGNVKTEDGAGIMLYSVSSSLRAASKEAREVDEKMKKAKKEGKLAQNAAPTAENLEAIGYSKDKALKMAASYNVYNSAKNQAQESRVMAGFGNNGGEEFLSFLQTGESMVIGRDVEWKKWYTKTANVLTSIQNQDGSWNGHHCITSPVFCTATCLMVLSIQNDIDRLIAQGADK